MVRDLENAEKVVADIFMKDGEEFGCRDLPSNPFKIPGMFAFWSGGDILVVQMSDIYRIRFYEDYSMRGEENGKNISNSTA